MKYKWPQEKPRNEGGKSPRVGVIELYITFSFILTINTTYSKGSVI